MPNVGVEGEGVDAFSLGEMDLEAGGYGHHSSEGITAWQRKFGILGKVFNDSFPTLWIPDTTTDQLLCSFPSTDFLSCLVKNGEVPKWSTCMVMDIIMGVVIVLE